MHSILVLGLAGLIVGCGATMETTLDKEWETEVGEETRTINVEPQREHLIIGKDESTTIYDANGRVIYGGDEDTGLGDFLTGSAGETIASMDANELDYVILPDPGVALVFDYTASDDIIRAVDLEAGEEQWVQTDYRWSLEKYSGVGADIAGEVMQAAGIGAGAAAGAVSAAVTRERFVDNLVQKVPDENEILLKTIGELRLVDLATGDTQWTVDVSGSSIVHAEWLASGDLIAVISNSSLISELTGGREIIRLNPDNGEVRWRVDHDADAVGDTRVEGNRLLLQHADRDVEVFNLDEGTEVFEVGTSWKADVASYAGGVEYKGQEYQVSLVGGPLLAEDGVYVPNMAETQVVGAPHWAVQKFDRTSGDKLWNSDQVMEMNGLQDLTLVDGQVISRAVHRGGGALGSDPRQRVVGWSVSDGTMQWNKKTPWDFADAALIRQGPMGGEVPSAHNLVVNQNRAYVATDTSVTAYDATDGSLATSVSAQVPGQPVWVTRQEDTLIDIRSEGVSFHGLGHLSPVAEPITFDSEMITYELEENSLLVRTENGLYVLDLATQSLAGTIAQEDTGALVTGSLRSGASVTEGARSVFVLTPDWIVQKYRIP